MLHLLLLSSLFFTSCVSILNVELLPPIGDGKSQYSPFVLHEPGWGSYLMYYCKNVPIEGVPRDRVYRIENYHDGNTSNWVNDRVVIEGESESAHDDLSCSPGVIIDRSNTWHAYYVTANRKASLTLYLYHATAPAPGVKWTKHGQLDIGISQPFPGYLETPTPVRLNSDTIGLFFIGKGGCLYVSFSSDQGWHYTAPVKLDAECGSSHGRVTFDPNTNLFYFVNSHAKPGDSAPVEIHLSVSPDYRNFTNWDVLFRSKDVGLDRVWSPHLVIEEYHRVYYAGNRGKYNWWGFNTEMCLAEKRAEE